MAAGRDPGFGVRRVTAKERQASERERVAVANKSWDVIHHPPATGLRIRRFFEKSRRDLERLNSICGIWGSKGAYTRPF
jgi:hypothetical protein